MRRVREKNTRNNDKNERKGKQRWGVVHRIHGNRVKCTIGARYFSERRGARCRRWVERGPAAPSAGRAAPPRPAPWPPRPRAPPRGAPRSRPRPPSSLKKNNDKNWFFSLKIIPKKFERFDNDWINQNVKCTTAYPRITLSARTAQRAAAKLA